MRYDIPLREAQGRFQSRTPFCCNRTLRGFHGYSMEYGWLTVEWVRYIMQFRDGIAFTVKSYQTPIAWVMADGRVIVPPVRYSQTTRRHLRALGVRWSEPVVDTDVAA